MPSKDPIKAKERSRRYKARKRIEKYGFDAPSQRGKHGNHASGENHPRWKGGRIVCGLGYIKVRVGKEHPLSDPIGYAYEHLLVWVEAGNPKPPIGYNIHHKNGDKTDNRIENLELLSASEHMTLHNKEKPRGTDGRFLGGMVDKRHNLEDMPEDMRIREFPQIVSF